MSKIVQGGVGRSIVGIKIVAGGVTRTIQSGIVVQGGVNRTFFSVSAPAPGPTPPPTPAPPPPAPTPAPTPTPPPAPAPLGVAVMPVSVTTTRGSAFAGGSLSRDFTASASNAIGSVSFAWVLVSRANSAAFTPSGTSTNVLTLFAAWARTESKSIIETWQVTASDGGGRTASTQITYELDIDSTN